MSTPLNLTCLAVAAHDIPPRKEMPYYKLELIGWCPYQPVNSLILLITTLSKVLKNFWADIT